MCIAVVCVFVVETYMYMYGRNSYVVFRLVSLACVLACRGNLLISSSTRTAVQGRSDQCYETS